jgi:large subunit ribosomal protein L23
MNDAKTLKLIPRLSEKAFSVSEVRNTFIFVVPRESSKQSIAAAVTAQLGVQVASVRVLNQKGKSKRTIRKNGRPAAGRNSDMKKAYVQLKQGESLPFFLDSSDQEKKPEAKGKK